MSHNLAKFDDHWFCASGITKHLNDVTKVKDLTKERD